MFVRKTTGPRTAVLGDGSVLSHADLPPTGARWVARRKAVVVAAIEHGLIGRGEAIDRYGLTDEELDSWSDAVHRHGIAGLKVTTLQQFRQQPTVDR